MEMEKAEYELTGMIHSLWQEAIQEFPWSQKFQNEHEMGQTIILFNPM